MSSTSISARPRAPRSWCSPRAQRPGGRDIVKAEFASPHPTLPAGGEGRVGVIGSFDRRRANVSQDLKPNESTQETAVSRREFAAVSLAAGLAAVAGARAADAAELPLIEADVTGKTSDGNCDAAFIHPTTGVYPGVLIWPDAGGLRPAMRQFARRIASEGYAVLVPNPFYRTAKAPVFEDLSTFDFDNPADRAKLPPLTGPVTAAGAAEKDAVAYVAFLDAQKEVDKTRKIGTQGYCMGGSLVVRTAAAVADRVGAGVSFHGGGLVADNPDSPRQNGMPIYNMADAERAWGKLVALYKMALG